MRSSTISSYESLQYFIWPTKGIFTSGYGWREGEIHKSIDISNDIGTPIIAAKNGVVVYAGWKNGEGKVIELLHRDRSKTRYLHCSKVFVKEGQLVFQGSRIALMGNTGTDLQPHLGFEIHRPDGATCEQHNKVGESCGIDPMAVLPGGHK